MTTARRSAVPIAMLFSIVVAASACSSEAPDTGASPTTTVAETSTASPTSSSVVAEASTSIQESVVASSPTRTPEEVSDLWPWSQPWPSADSGTVDPALYATAPSKFNFTDPTGNVQCGIRVGPAPEGQVGCQAETSVAPYEAPACTNAANDKYAVRVDEAGSHHLCTTQGIYTAMEPRVLEYGQVLSVAGVVCESDDVMGVSCWGTEGAFTFSDEWNETFGNF